jgi:hypothetical protein
MDQVPQVCQTSTSSYTWEVLQVNIVQLQFLQAGFDCTGNVVDVVVVNFGCDEKLLARDTTLLDGSSEFGLCLVYCMYPSVELWKTS